MYIILFHYDYVLIYYLYYLQLNDDYDDLSKTLDYIIEINSDIFPKVHWYDKIDDFLVIFMEHIFDMNYSIQNNIYGNKLRNYSWCIK